MVRKNSSKEMLKDKDINRWYQNVCRGAMVTGDTYLRRLRAFCKWADKEPVIIASMDDEDLYYLLLDFVTSEEKRGMAGSYIESSIKAVKSWLHFKGRNMTRKIKIKGATHTPSLVNERVPTQEELKKIFLSASSRGRVASVLMSHSGLRPEVLGNYLGDDGLRIKDFPEMKVNNNSVEFEKIPTMVVIRPELSKTNLRYFSFLSEEGCQYLRNYLEERIRKGEKLDKDTDIITPRNADKKFIRALNVGDLIRNGIRKAGFEWRPYNLRCYCDTQLLLTESKGKMVQSYRVFLMGHKGGIDSVYTTQKSKLPDDLIEDMRESYRQGQEYLQTIISSSEEEERMNATFKRNFLNMIGVSSEEINKMDLSGISKEEIMDMFKRKIQSNQNGNHNGDMKHKVIPIDELEGYLDDGWEFENNLTGDKVLIKQYNHSNLDVNI